MRGCDWSCAYLVAEEESLWEWAVLALVVSLPTPRFEFCRRESTVGQMEGDSTQKHWLRGQKHLREDHQRCGDPQQKSSKESAKTPVRQSITQRALTITLSIWYNWSISSLILFRYRVLTLELSKAWQWSRREGGARKREEVSHLCISDFQPRNGGREGREKLQKG